MANFQTMEDVEAWVVARGLDGEGQLRDAISEGRVAGRNAAFANAWLARQDTALGASASVIERERMERNTVSAEGSAAATVKAANAAVESALEAKRSADAAMQSVKWARIAAAISLAALFLAAWPLITSRLG